MLKTRDISGDYIPLTSVLVVTHKANAVFVIVQLKYMSIAQEFYKHFQITIFVVLLNEFLERCSD